MNRRKAMRFAEPGHLWWSRLGEAFQCRGWIADQSTGGFAFISPFARRLQPGDTIDVSQHHGPRHNASAPSSRFAIKRVEPYDDRLSLVACIPTQD